MGSAMSASRIRRARRRTIIRVVLLVAAVAVALGAALGARLLQVNRDLRAVRDAFNAAERQLKAGQPAAARASVIQAEARAAHATTILHNRPEVTLAYPIPIVHQNLAALRSVTAVALRISTAGVSMLQTAKPLEAANGKFEVPMRAGALPLETINRLRPELHDLAETLPSAAEIPRSRWLLPPVRRLDSTVFRQSSLRRRQAVVLSQALDLLAELGGANGPRRYLIAVANAAEMRGSGGMILAYGQLKSSAGQFSLDTFGGIDQLKLSTAAPAPPEAPRDYLAHYDNLGPTLNWRNANLTMDFTEAGPVMEAMFKQATGNVADGVLQIDSMGLAAFLRGTGPVDVPNLGSVNADNVVRVSLSDAYARFPTDRTSRQEVLGDIAQAVFKKVVTGDYPSLRPLATALIESVDKRHMLLHMGEDAAQRLSVGLGVDGAIPRIGPDFLAMGVQNFSGNKLDYYLDTGLRFTGQRRAGQVGRVQAEVTLTNTAPPGQSFPAYVFGPFDPALHTGEYVGLVTLYLPRGAALLGALGDLSGGSAGVFTDADRTVVHFPIHVGAGSTAKVTLDLQLPPGAARGYGMILMPISRVRPTSVTVDLARGSRKSVHYTGALTQPVVLRDPSG